MDNIYVRSFLMKKAIESPDKTERLKIVQREEVPINQEYKNKCQWNRNKRNGFI